MYSTTEGFFSLIFLPPDNSSACVSDMYEVVIIQHSIKEPTTTTKKILVPVVDTGNPTVFINRSSIDSFDVCSFNYSFVVRAANNEIYSDPKDALFDYRGK